MEVSLAGYCVPDGFLQARLLHRVLFHVHRRRTARQREIGFDLSTLFSKTRLSCGSVARFRIGQKQRSLWAGRHGVTRIGAVWSWNSGRRRVGGSDQIQQQQKTGLLLEQVPTGVWEEPSQRRKTVGPHDNRGQVGKQKIDTQLKNVPEPGPSWSNPGTLLTGESQRRIEKQLAKSHNLQAFTKLRDMITAPRAKAADRQAQVDGEFVMFLEGMDGLMRAIFSARTELEIVTGDERTAANVNSTGMLEIKNTTNNSRVNL